MTRAPNPSAPAARPPRRGRAGSPRDRGSEPLRVSIPQLDASFDRAVELLAACRGRVVCTGMGKSGLIMNKVAATLASTGTPALSLHPAEALHGDLGMIVPKETSCSRPPTPERRRSSAA